jgi:hypothetical protein
LTSTAPFLFYYCWVLNYKPAPPAKTPRLLAPSPPRTQFHLLEDRQCGPNGQDGSFHILVGVLTFRQRTAYNSLEPMRGTRWRSPLVGWSKTNVLRIASQISILAMVSVNPNRIQPSGRACRSRVSEGRGREEEEERLKLGIKGCANIIIIIDEAQCQAAREGRRVHHLHGTRPQCTSSPT